jgi:hypothetical protein
MDEREYLQNEALKAREAMVKTAMGIGQDLEHSANPLQWTRDYPWKAMLTAAAAGFAAAAIIAPLAHLPIPKKWRSKPAKSEENGQSEPHAEPVISFIKAELLTLATDVAGRALKAFLHKSASSAAPPPTPQPATSPENCATGNNPDSPTGTT